MASRRPEASIECVQWIDGSGEARKIHCVTQYTEPLKEDDAMKLRGIQCPDAELPAGQERNQLIEEKAIKETIETTTPSEAGRCGCSGSIIRNVGE